MLTERVESWREAGGFEEVPGRRLYAQRRDGEAPLLLLLHGFPSSSYDWRELLELRPGRAALAFDCLGFGLSDKPGDQSTRSPGTPTRPRSWSAGRARRRSSSSATTWAPRWRPS